MFRRHEGHASTTAGTSWPCTIRTRPRRRCPSRKDLERNYSESVVNLIISLQSSQPEVRGWWLTAGELSGGGFGRSSMDDYLTGPVSGCEAEALTSLDNGVVMRVG